jgi:hypothetical protein
MWMVDSQFSVAYKKYKIEQTLGGSDPRDSYCRITRNRKQLQDFR